MITVLQQCTAQETLIDMLAEYSRQDSNKVFSFNITNTGFEPEQSFILTKNDHINKEYKCILTQNNSTFSFWAVFENTYKYDIQQNSCIYISFALLFDKINQKLFYIEYNNHPINECPFRFNKNLDLEYAMPHFESWITKVIELNNKFYPIRGFYTSWKLGYSIGKVTEMYVANNIWWHKTFDIDKKYEKTPYEYFITISSEDFKEIPSQKIENDYFFPLYMSVNL